MFQSYLIISNNQGKIDQETKKLAESLSIDLKKTSPDVFIISPLKNTINIDQIRSLKKHIFQKPVDYKYKFVVIKNAHTATTQAQNSFLKILEEPPEGAIIVLEAKNKKLLLDTVISRVKTIQVKESQKAINGEIFATLKPQDALEKLAKVDDPQQFLDDQIHLLANLLTENAKGTKTQMAKDKIVKTIEKYREAKEMIGANLSPTFTLANLVLLTNH